MPVGKKIVVIGGRIQGCETAEFLTKRGRQVTIVDSADALGEGMTGDDKALLFPWFDKKGVKRYMGVKFESIAGGKLNVTTKDGQKLTLEGDTVMTVAFVPNSDIMNHEGKSPEVYFIGDCPGS
jgi:pyruvate/2-oxoglutarate dehydrogenase complex dihydrolipoamide dehydrogenase (E3) component